MKTYELHSLATIFPRIMGEEFEEFADDIAANGLREPIVLFEGKVLDGVNRLRGCEARGVEPRFVDWLPGPGDSPEAYVISANLRHRHMNDAQRALIGARLCTHTGPGRKGKPRSDPDEITSAKAGAMLNVHPKMIARARSLIKHAEPERIEAIERGEAKIGAQLGDKSRRREVPKAVASVAALLRPEPEPEPNPKTNERLPLSERLFDMRPHAPAPVTETEKKHLLAEIADLIDAISSRPREVATIAHERRVELTREFAAALGLVKRAEFERSHIGSGLA